MDKDKIIKVGVKESTLRQIDNLFTKKKRSPILSREKILDKIDSLMKENLREKKRYLKKESLSSAMICENYFFCLLFLKEDILGKELSYPKEVKRLSLKPSKAKEDKE